MDEELQLLETELKQLRPAAPSRELLQRLARELKPVRRERPFAWSLWWAALPAAALAVVFANIMRRDVSSPGLNLNDSGRVARSSDMLKPVEAENVLYSARDEGLVTLDDGSVARRERLSYVDTITWRNPKTHASLKWSVPREEVRVVPVSFQ